MGKEIIPVADKVLVEMLDESTTDAGLVLPQGAQEKETVGKGEVVKTGPGYPVYDSTLLDHDVWLKPPSKLKFIPLQVQVKDIVYFVKSLSYEVEIDKKKYWIVPSNAILLIIRNTYSFQEEI